jgi:ubiquitin-protein ligase
MKTNKEDASNKTAEDIGHDIKNTHAEVKSAIDKVK